MSFTISLIDAKSEVPLYLNTVGGRKVVTTAWQTLWKAPNTPTHYSFATINLSNPIGVINLRVTCHFGSTFVGKTLTVQGLVNNTIAVTSLVTVTTTAPIIVHSFRLQDPRPGPVAYYGLFHWRLLHGSTIVATFGTFTLLELYTAVRPAASLWPPFGVSVNLLRHYVARWNAVVRTWNIADFYRFTTQAIFAGSFKYDNVYGASRFTSSLGGTYRLDQYFSELEMGLPSHINCYDMAGIVQIVLSLFPLYNQVRWNFMGPYGYISTAILKGFGYCNNPFWGNSFFYPNPIAPVNYVAGQKERSAFANHAFISAVSVLGTRILDSTCGPHTGTQDLATYIATSIDHVTNYYARHPGSGPGTVANINPNHSGVVSIVNVPAITTMVAVPAIPAEGISTVTSSGEEATPASEHEPLEEAKVPHAVPKPGSDPVDDAMERAKVKDADPPRLAKVDPSALKPHVEKSLKLTLASESLTADANGSHAHWRFGTEFDSVELKATTLKSHDAAVETLRATLQSIQAPLDIVLAQKSRLGQRSLSGVGGTGFILFVRGNVFIRLEGLDNSEVLGKIATDIDGFLRAREGDSKGIPGPSVPVPKEPQRKVVVGTTFKISLNVKDVGYMTALSDPSIVQLIEVDEEHATFVFFANAPGKADVQLVFVHVDTMQVATAVVHVEVVKAGPD